MCMFIGMVWYRVVCVVYLYCNGIILVIALVTVLVLYWYCIAMVLVWCGIVCVLYLYRIGFHWYRIGIGLELY